VLRVYATWILAVTLLAVVSACVLSWATFKPTYQSVVRILVEPDATRGGTPLLPDMENEQQVVSSGTVASAAARVVGTSTARLQQGLSVSVPGSSTVLVLRYADRTAAVAQRDAQAIADAYVANRAGQAAILDTASLPASTTRPNYLLNGAAGLALGLLLGVGGAVLRDRLDDSVRGPRDLADQTELPVLATVQAPAGDDGARIVVRDAPDSPAAEAYRQLRGKVGRAARNGGRTPTVTLVTSASWDDGAVDVAANTAVALASAGMRVLLVDGDLREPRLAALFDVAADGGLSGVLAGTVTLAEAVRATGVDGLQLLPAGADVPFAPRELFDERAVNRLLGQSPDEVDHVLVKAPPVIGAAETASLAERSHLLLVVAAAGETTRRDLNAALAELRDVPAQLLGAVLCEVAGAERRPARLQRGRDVAPSAEAVAGEAT
jgi:capsular exopolysaccharide synthesis family protein